MSRVAGVAILISFTSSIIWAQGTTLLDRACGPSGAQFSVHSGGLQSPLPLQQSKSKVVVFTEAISSQFGCRYVITPVGIDGKWIGASCVGSYISADIAPGEHHLCVNLEGKQSAEFTALHAFTAEEGKTYYFRAEVLEPNSFGVNYGMHLDPIDEDEGLYLATVRTAAKSEVK